jgi:hypothetical protein
MLTEKERIKHIDKLLYAKDSVLLSKNLKKRVSKLKEDDRIWLTSNESGLPAIFIKAYVGSGFMDVRTIVKGKIITRNVPFAQFIRKVRTAELNTLNLLKKNEHYFLSTYSNSKKT